jgi:hypothetical protein
MATRTSIFLDPETKKAAKQLSTIYDCSTSEAIRRAVIHHRDAVLGISPESQKKRQHILCRLFELFEGNEAEEEIQRLKKEDEGF